MNNKGFEVGGATVISETEDEAIAMYIAKMGRKPEYIIETNLDDIIYYFDLHEIDEEDHVNIYDRRFPSDGRHLVSLKRPYAKK